MLKANLKLLFKAIGLIVVVVLFVLGVAYLSLKNKDTEHYFADDNDLVFFSTKNLPQNTANPAASESDATPESLPSKKLLQVAFAAQAPFGDWSEPYENACEEASIITVEHYLKDQGLSKSEMKTEIDVSVDWQIKNWGQHVDLNASETLKLATDYFKLRGKLIESVTAQAIKQEIVAGYPVIVPTAGRKLGNPNFRGAGPEYHMLVIKGYDDNQGVFITNDVGTRKGESYIYKYDVLMNAISGPREDMEKTVLVLGE